MTCNDQKMPCWNAAFHRKVSFTPHPNSVLMKINATWDNRLFKGESFNTVRIVESIQCVVHKSFVVQKGCPFFPMLGFQL